MSIRAAIATPNRLLLRNALASPGLLTERAPSLSTTHRNLFTTAAYSTAAPTGGRRAMPQSQSEYELNMLTGDPGNPAPPPEATSKASKAKGFVSSILHGSTKEKEIEEQTHSKLLARGKYVHELQIHNVKPDAMEDYKALIAQHYARIAGSDDFSVKLFGSWVSEFGDLDQAIHIWEYDHYPGYQDSHKKFAKDEKYQAFLRQLAPMLRSRENQMLLEFAFWQSSPPRVFDGIFELRSYLLKPGRLLEWETEWRRGLEARRQFIQPIGAWFSQLGQLNWVHHMWVYPDLQTRKEMREKAWQIDGWPQTVAKTVTMTDQMYAKILRPAPFSPLK